MNHTLPRHMSHSQMTTFFACAHQYYLGKIRRLPENPAIYLVSGSAIHAMIESLNHHIVSEGLQDV
jgi:ATP-dependent helicase/DNAse subunit B